MIIKGYCLEDYYGEEWEKRYYDCVNDIWFFKRSISIKDIVRLVLWLVVEIGIFFIFNCDIVNWVNFNVYWGIIYCLNFCMEIV